MLKTRPPMPLRRERQVRWMCLHRGWATAVGPNSFNIPTTFLPTEQPERGDARPAGRPQHTPSPANPQARERKKTHHDKHKHTRERTNLLKQHRHRRQHDGVRRGRPGLRGWHDLIPVLLQEGRRDAPLFEGAVAGHPFAEIQVRRQPHHLKLSESLTQAGDGFRPRRGVDDELRRRRPFVERRQKSGREEGSMYWSKDERGLGPGGGSRAGQ